MNALIFGYSYALLAAPASLLMRSGFNIHLLCPYHKHINTANWIEISSPQNMLVKDAIELVESKNYDLVVIGDDYCMADVIDGNLPVEVKLKVLPVIASDHFSHLFSKCRLSQILSKSGINTPEYEICHTQKDLIEGSKRIGYPLFIKVDRSGGGCGVFECLSCKDLIEQSQNLKWPLLLQKKIEGNIIDMTAFYQKGCLVDFSYSSFHKTVGGPFGASSVRKYTQLGYLPREVFDELDLLGQALGSNGFVNITCIEDRISGKRYFIEADMRPNVWVDHGKYIGGSGEKNISQWFANGWTLTHPQKINPLFPKSKLISYVDRLTPIELIFNQYKCWDSFESRDKVLPYILRRFGYQENFFKKMIRLRFYQLDLFIRLTFSRHLKPWISEPTWNNLRKNYRKIFRISR